MSTNDFNYDLPQELIAQTPLEDRTSSRLLVLNKDNGKLKHDYFYNIKNYLKKGDVLVFNDTKVIPARLYGIKAETGAVIELLLLKELGSDSWECLAKPGKRLKVGTVILFGDGKLKAMVKSKNDDGVIIVQLIYTGILMEILDELGTMPLPPYIHEKLDDQSRYQTVYAKNYGSAAAPTAGLHFTNNVINELESLGIQVAYVTLHVGLGTFRPVEVDDVTDHKMHTEIFEISDETANILNKAKSENRRIISVGTTTTRTLETVMMKNNGKFIKMSGETDIFIYPGYKFQAVDALITNFHLPKSTLLMLVSALSSRDIILNAYKEAVNNKYRFFSFGDAMFITGDDF